MDGTRRLTESLQTETDRDDARDKTEKHWLRRAHLVLSCVGFLFLVEIVTGLLLMTVYSPSTTGAWGSVWYVQTQMQGGWLVRGLHHVTSNAMIVVLLTGLGWLITSRSWGGTVSVRWWTVLVSLGFVLGASLCGVLLPWDQHGYWGTTVRSNILARTPFFGSAMRTLLWGGDAMGNLTLARFYTLHVFVMPGLLAGVLWFYRRLSGPTTARRIESGERLRSTVVRALILVVLIGVTWYACQQAGTTLLGAPADPSAADYPARPEWHTLFLYQWLKYFQGPTAEVVGAIVIPGTIVALLFVVPVLRRYLPGERTRRVLVGAFAALLVAMGGLTVLALWADRNPGDERILGIRARYQRGEPLSATDSAALRASEFNAKRSWAARNADRAMALATELGVPPLGALQLLADDPTTRGPTLFAANCSSCHRFAGHDGTGLVPLDPPASSDLSGFGSRAWIRGFLLDPMNERYFGLMRTPEGEPAHTRMAKWLAERREELESDEAKKQFEDNLDAVASYLEFESLQPGRFVGESGDMENRPNSVANSVDVLDDLNAGVRAEILRGREFFATACNECHSYGGFRNGTLNAPEMLGYGSEEWIALMIAEPDHESRYRSKGREPARMPRFVDRIGAFERKLLANWLFLSRNKSEEGQNTK